MRFHFAGLVTALALAACAGSPAAEPAPTLLPAATASLRPTAAAPQPSPVGSTATPPTGTVAGRLCYPGAETPPMTLYLAGVDGQITQLNIERGQTTYRASLPPGQYTVYAKTAGMNLLGAYTCASYEPCPFEVSGGQTTTVDLCDWYNPPGYKPPLANQPDSEVWVRLAQNMQARTGPHLNFSEAGLLEAGSLLPAIRRSNNGEWLLVRHPGLNVTGWLHAPLTQIMGNPFNLPIEAESPPPLEPAGRQFTPAIWQSSFNQNIVHFKGEIRDEAGRPVNGYSILLDNGTWSVLSHPTGASHHYPDVEDGKWDVVISNQTDAAGWWTMTVVRYNCPHFEIGFNAQCKEFVPLSETKVVKVVHPDENVIEANWTCLKNCDQGLYVKPYRRPVEPIADHLLLYIEDRSLKSSPPSPVFDQPAMKTLYDSLPDTPTGLTNFLARNRPRLSPNGRYLLVNAPNNITWLADMHSGELRQFSRPAVAAAWSPTGEQITYFKEDTLYLRSLAGDESRAIWQQPGLPNPVVNWPNQITVEAGQSGWRIRPDGRAEAYQPEAMPEALRQAVAERGYLPPTTWAVSHSGQQVAFNISLGDPLTNAIILFDTQRQTVTPVGPINGYRVPEIRWTSDDDLLLIGATNPKFPSGGAIFTMLPQPGVLPEALLESDTAYLVDIWPEPE